MLDAKSKIAVSIEKTLDSYAGKKVIRELLIKFSRYFAVMSAIIITGVFLEVHYNLGSYTRTLLFYTLSCALLTFIVLSVKITSGFLSNYLTKRRKLICEIDAEFSNNRILMLFDLLKFPSGDILAEAAVKDIHGMYLKSQKKPEFLSYRAMSSTYRRILIAAVLMTILVYNETTFSALGRIIDYKKDFTPPASHSLVMRQTRIFIPEYDTVSVVLNSSGKIPDILSFRRLFTGADGYSSSQVAHAGGGEFFVTEPALKSFSCFFESDETVSDTCFVSVLKRPEIAQVRMVVESPGYTKIPGREYTGSASRISAYKGSTISFSLLPGQSGADSVTVYFSDGSRKKMIRTEDGEFSAKISLKRSLDFHFSIFKNSEGKLLSNLSPVVHKIDVLGDEYPFVNLIYPEDGMLLDDTVTIPVFATASDDFEISRTSLFMRKISLNRFSGKIIRSENIVKELKHSGQREGITIVNEYASCADLNLLPEDKVEIFLRVYDNDDVSGPKFTDSKVRTVVLPSLEQLFSSTEKNYENQKVKIESELERNREILEKISEMSEKLKKNQELNWEDKNKIDQMMSDQEQMNSSLEDLEKEINKNISLLDENSLLSEETMKKYIKLQELVEDMFSKDIKDKLKKLSEISENDKLDRNSYAEFLKNFEENQKQFKEGLEKSIEILQQIKNEYLLDRLIKNLDDMITRQNEVNSSIDGSEIATEEKIRNEERIDDSYSSFEKELTNAGNELKDTGINKIIEDSEDKKISKDISSIKDEIRSGNNDKAKNTGAKIASKMLSIKDQLSGLKEDMLNKQKDELRKEIEAVISDLLAISDEIERLKNFSKDIPADSGHSSRVIRDFSRIGTGLERSGDKIFEISKKTFFIDRSIIAQVGIITELYNNISSVFKNRYFSFSFERNAMLMGRVNNLIVLLYDAADEINSSESPSGLEEMLKKMEELARKQAALNMQTSGAMSNSESGGMSQMQEMMNRLAKEQAQLYDALMKMSSAMNTPGQQGDPGSEGSPGSKGDPGDGMEPGGAGGSGAEGINGQKGNSGPPVQDGQGSGESGRRGLGKRLGDIGSEMKDIEKQLQDKKLDESLLSKQNQVLDKLLDTIESVKREKLERKRESRAGNRKALDPGKIEIMQGGNLKEMLIRSLKDGYTNEYKIKIKKYFREIEN
jgi:hypothetical protein